METPKKITFLTAKSKIEAWCAYQERCHSEVYKKLRDYGLDDEDAQILIAHLITENYLNEERFTESYVSGKFNIKKWGKRKIQAHLKQKNVPIKIIEKALSQIEDDQYLSILFQLAERKWKEKKGNDFEKKVKVQRYLANKGYDFDSIYVVLEQIEAEYKKNT